MMAEATEDRMKRTLVLGTVLALGAVAYAASPQAPPPVAARDAARIEKVKDNLYVITGSGAGNTDTFSGGNTAVFVADTGVTLVDTKLPGFGPTLIDRIRSVTDKPVTRIINTHAHGDHTGSNGSFDPKVEIIVHEGARAFMNKERETRTYKDRLTIGSGGDQIDLYYFGRGHTGGDTFVVFRSARTMHVGDMFAWKGLPYVDPGAGGSVLEHPESLARAVATVKDVDTIINGHIPTSSWDDFRTYADFSREFVTFAEASRKAGKTVDQAAAEYRVADRYKGYAASVTPLAGPAANLKLAYEELSRR
jgi:glyoxylase-like metal-dependent hydrolase (beta-lactamase superfamily II)